MTNAIAIPGVGNVVLVDREKMRRKGPRRMFSRLARFTAEVPAPPASCDWSHNEQIKFPVLGNDQQGDCYYAAILHMAQLQVGQYRPAPQFDTQQVLSRYEQLSGGDNGLSDSDVYPEWKRGILGPDGPHKILDSLIVDTLNPDTLTLAIWGMGGCLYTCSLPRGWANNASPGAVWGTGAGGSVGGHAIILTGYKPNGYFDLRTWGISPPIQVTYEGIMENDPEVIVVFSAEMFDPTTRLSPAGFTWEQTRQIWVQHGGHDVGPAPWPTPAPGPVDPPAPAPAPSPAPAPLQGISGTATGYIDVPHGVWGSVRVPVNLAVTGQTIGPLPTHFHAIGDGHILKIIVDNLPAILQIIGMFVGKQQGNMGVTSFDWKAFLAALLQAWLANHNKPQ
jgi:hypothetical protein